MITQDPLHRALAMLWIGFYTTISVVFAVFLPFSHFVLAAHFFLRGVPMVLIHTRRHRMPPWIVMSLWSEDVFKAWLPVMVYLLQDGGEAAWRMPLDFAHSGAWLIVGFSLYMAPITAYLIPRAWWHTEEIVCGKCKSTLWNLQHERVVRVIPLATEAPVQIPIR